MLNLGVMFRQIKLSTFVVITFFLAAFSASFQAPFTVNVYAPESGDAVQGLVPVSGNTDVDGFASYEISFALDAARGTWFQIVHNEVPVKDGLLGEWDTSNLTDDLYVLRMVVEIEGGDSEIRYIENLRVRNYSPIETNTPLPTNPAEPEVAATVTPTLLPATPTPIGKNPGGIQEEQILGAIRNGIIFGLFILIILWLYNRSQRRL